MSGIGITDPTQPFAPHPGGTGGCATGEPVIDTAAWISVILLGAWLL